MATKRKDIAEAARVHPSVISAVMNGSKSIKVSESKRKLILSLIKEMNYRPNQAARSLRTKRSYNIGIILPSPLDPFYAAMVADIQHGLAESDYTGIFSFWETSDKIKTAVDNILKYDIEGLITNEPAYLPDDLKIPVVTYHYEHKDYDYVDYENDKVIQVAINYLLELGHYDIGFVGIKDSGRMKAFVKQSRKAEIKSNIYEFNLKTRTIDGLEEKFRSKEIPDAIITHTDEAALLAIQYAWRYGLQVPRDVSIIGCNNIWSANLSVPPLTTIQRAGKPFGKLLLEILIERLENPAMDRVKCLASPELIERGSCTARSNRST